MQRPQRDPIGHPVGLHIAVGGFVAVDGAHGHDEGVHQPDVVEVGVEAANILGPAGYILGDRALDPRIHRLTVTI